jgi:predicted RNase H-like nuclease (RuvC/YqgF family)
MSIEDSELKIGGQTFKGAWIAVVLAIGSTIGGGVWTASSLYSRLEAVEGVQVPDIVPLEEKVSLIEQELTANDVSQLQGKLAELGVNLKTIAEQQEKLLSVKEEVKELKESVIQMQTTVEKAELILDKVDKFEAQVKSTSREIQDLWDGMDYLSNPLN